MKTNRLMAWSTSLLYVVFLLSAAILFVFLFTPLYSWSIDWFSIEQATKLTKSVLEQNYMVLISYLTIPWISELSMPNFPSSAWGLLHFREVKWLVMVDMFVVIFSFVALVIAFRILAKERQLWQLLVPLRILFVVPIIVLLAIACFFDKLFIIFHQVFFNNNAWIFDPNFDPVINALPEEFFMVCFFIVFISLMVGIMLGYRLLVRYLARKS